MYGLSPVLVTVEFQHFVDAQNESSKERKIETSNFIKSRDLFFFDYIITSIFNNTEHLVQSFHSWNEITTVGKLTK